MKKILFICGIFLCLIGISQAEIERYNSRLPMMVYKGRESPYVLKLSSEGSVLTQAEIEAITKAAIIFNEETIDSDTCTACFDFGTGYKENGQILVDFGSVDFTPGRDRSAELIVYNAEYTNGRVFGTLDVEVSNEASEGATLVDPLIEIYLDLLDDVEITDVQDNDILIYNSDTGNWENGENTGAEGSDDQTASEVATSTTAFDNNLSASDDTVQKALETLDELVAGGSGSTDPDDLDGDTVNDNLVDVAIIPTAAPSNNDTTHIPTSDNVYDWVIGRGYLTAEVDGNITNEIEVVDEAYSAANFNGGAASAVSQDDFYDYNHIADTDDDGYPNYIDSATSGFVKSSAAGLLSIDTNTYLTAEVDGSVSNEINTFTGDNAATTSGLAITVTGAGNVTTSVSGNTLTITGTAGAYTAGDALTLTGNDIDFDGGATPAGDLGGTWADPSVDDDSHAHTGSTISGLSVDDFTSANISAWTNDSGYITSETDDQTASEVSVTDANDYFVGDTQEEVNDEIGAAQEVPTDLTADFYLFGTTSATLNWGVSNDNRITGYRLYQADYPGDFATVYDFATSTNTYTVTGLEYDHDYQFKVVSTDGVTESDNMSKIVVHVREDAGGADTASEVAVEDTEENFTGEDVEAVLAEIKDELDGITPTLSIIELTGTTSLTADQLTNSRIFLGHSALATYTFASAQDAYELGEPVTVFIFTTTNPADFDCQAGDKITYVAGEKTTMDDGDKMSAVSPELYDSFVVTPIKIGADYQWLINCVSGDYEDGGP